MTVTDRRIPVITRMVLICALGAVNAMLLPDVLLGASTTEGPAAWISAHRSHLPHTRAELAAVPRVLRRPVLRSLDSQTKRDMWLEGVREFEHRYVLTAEQKSFVAAATERVLLSIGGRVPSGADPACTRLTAVFPDAGERLAFAQIVVPPDAVIRSSIVQQLGLLRVAAARSIEDVFAASVSASASRKLDDNPVDCSCAEDSSCGWPCTLWPEEGSCFCTDQCAIVYLMPTDGQGGTNWPVCGCTGTSTCDAGCSDDSLPQG